MQCVGYSALDVSWRRVWPGQMHPHLKPSSRDRAREGRAGDVPSAGTGGAGSIPDEGHCRNKFWDSCRPLLSLKNIHSGQCYLFRTRVAHIVGTNPIPKRQWGCPTKLQHARASIFGMLDRIFNDRGRYAHNSTLCSCIILTCDLRPLSCDGMHAVELPAVTSVASWGGRMRIPGLDSGATTAHESRIIKAKTGQLTHASCFLHCVQ